MKQTINPFVCSDKLSDSGIVHLLAEPLDPKREVTQNIAFQKGLSLFQFSSYGDWLWVFIIYCSKSLPVFTKGGFIYWNLSVYPKLSSFSCIIKCRIFPISFLSFTVIFFLHQIGILVYERILGNKTKYHLWEKIAIRYSISWVPDWSLSWLTFCCSTGLKPCGLFRWF